MKILTLLPIAFFSTTVAVTVLLHFVNPVVAAEHDHGDDDGHSDTLYSCGMHPTVIQDTPGNCPICGMTLTPKKAPTQQHESKNGEDKKQREIAHWVSPMDPTFISDKPGKSPMGMDLVPVYKGGGLVGTLKIDPVVVQNMGVRIKPVRRQDIFRHVRTIGTVDVAEDQLSVVNLRYSGWIEKIYVDETGILVKKGDPLFSIYSPELVSAQEEYLLALRSASHDSPLVKSAHRRLSFWNLSNYQIDQVAKGGKALRNIIVTAPQTGYVLHKKVVLGARVKAGADLYRIGNLAKIWINAEVYEYDAPWIKLGQTARMELGFQAGKSYLGEVAYIYPTLNPKTRTLTVRMEFDNPGLALKPGMFATVHIESQRKEKVIALPTEAIIHSGRRQIVFVAIDLGRYKAQEITTGLVGDGFLVEVLTGLQEGERVVTSGQFLLDSESQLQEAVQKLLAARLHSKEKAVGTVNSDQDEGIHKDHEHSATKTNGDDFYYTCGMHPAIVQDAPGTCPICGMNLTKKNK